MEIRGAVLYSVDGAPSRIRTGVSRLAKPGVFPDLTMGAHPFLKGAGEAGVVPAMPISLSE
jgi:hypothetical protein